ncbi:MAG: hypothetical protein JXQ75_17445 [Phycisphaerae bacterium]|nr:hypothetical protein [Phycisphaerae bacterium]
MTRGAVTDFLIRAVLDEPFRELALADPQRAFVGYDLSEEEQEILRSRDGRLLGLLGKAVAYAKALVEHPAKGDLSEATESSLPSLPEVNLLLRLDPRATQRPGSALDVAYAATLAPWPGGDHERKTTDAENGEQTEQHSNDTPPKIAWIIRITPTVVDSLETGLKVAYHASIRPFAVGADGKQPSAKGPTQASATSPWRHDVESSAAKAAAQAVRASDAGRRYEKLLELIRVLQAGDDRG